MPIGTTPNTTYDSIVAAHRKILRQPNRVILAAGFPLDLERLFLTPKTTEEVTDITLGVRSDLPEPAFTVYIKQEDAEDEVDEDDEYDAVYLHTAYEWRQTPLEVEANFVQVTGISPIDNQAIRVFWRDDASQDPSLPPSARGPRHVGEERTLGISNHRLRSLDACRRALRAIVPRVADYRYVAELKSAFLRKENGAPVWRGDLIKVKPKGLYVVNSIQINFIIDPDPMALEGEDGASTTYVREATYCLERLKAWDEA